VRHAKGSFERDTVETPKRESAGSTMQGEEKGGKGDRARITVEKNMVEGNKEKHNLGCPRGVPEGEGGI